MFTELFLTVTGYKFETLSLLSKPWGETSRDEIEAREDEVVDNFAQYCSICRTEIGGASMIIGGEVDGGGLDDQMQQSRPGRLLTVYSSRIQAQRQRGTSSLD